MSEPAADAGEMNRLTPRRCLVATARCVRFYSRLPMPAMPGEGDVHALPDFRIEPVGLPVASLLIALPAVLMAALAGFAGLDPLLGAALVITMLVAATGALHEDGLCDTADGLFGGHTPERRLEIMKDSRIGAFGACALMLALLLRVAALAAIWRAGGLDAAIGCILIAAVVSRTDGVWVLAALPPARATGASAAVGRPTARTALIAAALACALTALLTALAGLPVWGVIGGIAIGLALVAGLAALARRLLGGQTGDIVGAAQQLAEIGLLVGVAAGLGAGLSR